MSWTRRDKHAGTWYDSNAKKLEAQVKGTYIINCIETNHRYSPRNTHSEARPNCSDWCERAAKKVKVRDRPVRAIIGPHAGYSYSGEAAGYAYCALNPESIKRIFVLGPSHHVYTKKCHVSVASFYRTPIGNISIDRDVCDELLRSKYFEPMDRDVDEDEHSIELHAPFIATVMKGRAFTMVPIMCGALNRESEGVYGGLLSKYLDDPGNFFVVSSDFCHWGRRFQFQWQNKDLGPIYKSVEWLDRRGMAVIETGSFGDFSDYISKYRNTICGRHSIGVMLNMLSRSTSNFRIAFTRYEQSNRCIKATDSSVSYASAVVTTEETE